MRPLKHSVLPVLALCPLIWTPQALWAEPTPLKNEAFLLFLAEMVEVDGQLTDPLDMSASDDEGQQYGQLIEQTDSGSVGESSPDAEEDEDEAI